MVKQFIEGVVDTVEVIWPRFRNTLVQAPTIMTLLPLTSVKDVIADLRSDAGLAVTTATKSADNPMLFEPDAASVLQAILRSTLTESSSSTPSTRKPPSTAPAWSP